MSYHRYVFELSAPDEPEDEQVSNGSIRTIHAESLDEAKTKIARECIGTMSARIVGEYVGGIGRSKIFIPHLRDEIPDVIARNEQIGRPR